jgi:hypothetical protein
MFPNKFKSIGLVITPISLFLWLLLQFNTSQVNEFISNYYSVDKTEINPVTILIAFSFLIFLIGIVMISFSKEKVEDEMVQIIRLQSFQFAAMLQMIFLIIGFLYILLKGDPSDNGFMSFLICLLSAFWISYISRFNFVLHFRALK